MAEHQACLCVLASDVATLRLPAPCPGQIGACQGQLRDSVRRRPERRVGEAADLARDARVARLRRGRVVVEEVRRVERELRDLRAHVDVAVAREREEEAEALVALEPPVELPFRLEVRVGLRAVAELAERADVERRIPVEPRGQRGIGGGRRASGCR